MFLRHRRGTTLKNETPSHACLRPRETELWTPVLRGSSLHLVPKTGFGRRKSTVATQRKTPSKGGRSCCPIMMSTPPRMVIQQNMERIASFYHASASIQPANHSDFFNTHRRYHSEPRSMSDIRILQQLPSPAFAPPKAPASNWTAGRRRELA